MKNSPQVRTIGRSPIQMTMLSGSLPGFKADILDISERGAKLKLAEAPNRELTERCFSFISKLPQQATAVFEGVARVAWVRETLDGFEAGLEWKTLQNATILGPLDILLGSRS